MTETPKSLSEHTSKSPSFDLDDAFSDGESDNGRYAFDPATIREELAKGIAENREAESRSGAKTPEDSISTLDIGHAVTLPEESQPSSPTDDFETASRFSEISLTTSNSQSSSNEQEVQITIEEPEDDESNASDAAHPPASNDGSKPSGHRVTLSIESNTTTIPQSQPNTPSSSSIALPPSPHTPVSALVDAASIALPPSLPSTPSAHTHQISSAPEPQGLTEPPQESRHRRAKSTGPSTFEKYMSKTRPIYLPPKSKQEDNKHMADWEAMMKQSRQAAEKRRNALTERRLAREKGIEDSINLWQKEIVPDWRVVKKHPHLRRLWWKGIPVKLRADLWERAVGNALALSRDNYRSCNARAKKAMSSGLFPAETLSLIDTDIASTLPSLHIFNKENGPLYEDLRDMLCAWLVSRSDEGLGYTYGAAKIAAMLLINMPIQQAFVVMRNLLERHCMRSFYGGSGARDDVEAYYRIFDTLLADGMPKIYFNFKQHQISPTAYLPEWLIPLFMDHLPFEACARLWDVIMLEGDAFLYRAALAILAVLEPRLFFPDRKELLDLLKGENKAAREVAKREGQPLDSGKYEIYGLDEETLWDRIDSMDEWWRESTWRRLIQRELPDL